MNDFIKIYVFNKKQNSSLFVLSLLSLGLILLRVKVTQTSYLLFLIWNLFLGIMPYIISSNLKGRIVNKKGNLNLYIKLLIWMLILPNSFYIITDFIHLHYVNTLQYLFDIIILSCFTTTGFYAGILSVYQIYQIITNTYSNRNGDVFILIISYLSAFGIYLGRILRFNSWDIISNPMHLSISIVRSLMLYETIIFTLLLGTLILVLYKATYHLILKNEINH